MQKKKLNKFIIISVAFHVILISAVLLYFIKYPLSGGKSGTVMVGVISTGNSDSAQHKPSSANEKTNTENSKQESKPKIALEKKPVTETVKNQKLSKQRHENKITDIAERELENTPENKSTLTSDASEHNISRSGNNIASIGQKGQTKSNNIGNNGSKDSLAYPDYNINPKPKYPRVARKRGYEGEVELKVFVLADGRVGEIEVVRPSGHKVLDDEAVDAVKDWIFVPGKQDGKEISSWVTVPITFQLKSG